MDKDNKQQILSQKYLEVIATLHGHQTISNAIHPSAIQIKETIERKLPKGRTATLLSNRSIHGHILPVPESQVKRAKGKVKINIEPTIYNEVIETTGQLQPTVLFICTWPSDQNGAIIFSREAMSLICTCYWYLPSKKTKPSINNKPVSIEIAEDQIVDTKAFGQIFETLYV